MPDAAKAAEWLAENLMEWRRLPASGAMNQDFYENKREEFQMWAEAGFHENVWHPHEYPDGLMQCFGPGAVVEAMIKQGWYFDLKSLGPPPDSIRMRFVNLPLLKDAYAFGDDICTATVIAAARALGWEG